MGQGTGQFPVKVNSLDNTGNMKQRMQSDERFFYRGNCLLLGVKKRLDPDDKLGQGQRGSENDSRQCFNAWKPIFQSNSLILDSNLLNSLPSQHSSYLCLFMELHDCLLLFKYLALLLKKLQGHLPRNTCITSTHHPYFAL